MHYNALNQIPYVEVANKTKHFGKKIKNNLFFVKIIPDIVVYGCKILPFLCYIFHMCLYYELIYW